MPLLLQKDIKSEFKKIPLYSQYLDIRESEWKTKSCGVVSLSMLLAFWGKHISPENLLKEGLFSGAYIPGIGWTHKGLAKLAIKQGLFGKNFDWFSKSPKQAFKKLVFYLGKYPVIASIHKNFKLENEGHLILLVEIKNNQIFYFEPNSKTRKNILQVVSIDKFLSGWKRRIILVKPKM
jgi:ABC-type bacteriocin/lantibiotic exporter with double-glycine peptidase domain